MVLNIKNIIDEKEVFNIIKFIEKQEQFYPNFYLWLNEKLKPRLMNERYKAYISVGDGNVNGCVIYDDKVDQIDIKNFRIDEKYQNRNLGRFLLKQLELFNKPLVSDITVGNFKAVKFFIRNGFDIVSMDELYQKGQLEYTIKKTIN